MDFEPPKDIPLYCPECGGAAKTIHPYYTVMDRWQWAGIKDQYTWYFLVTVLMVVWWPLGIVSGILVYAKSISEAKKAILYRCPNCTKEFSYSDATKAEK